MTTCHNQTVNGLHEDANFYQKFMRNHNGNLAQYGYADIAAFRTHAAKLLAEGQSLNAWGLQGNGHIHALYNPPVNGWSGLQTGKQAALRAATVANQLAHV